MFIHKLSKKAKLARMLAKQEREKYDRQNSTVNFVPGAGAVTGKYRQIKKES